MPRKKVTNEYGFTLREQTEIELRTLAKRANQRLRQLEKSGVTQASKAYGRIELWSYKGSKEFLSTTHKGQFKFKTSTKNRTTNQLKAEVRQLNIFLGNQPVEINGQVHFVSSSTVSGINKMYNQSYKSFKKSTGFTGTYTEYTNLISEDAFSWAVRNYGSERVINMSNELGVTRAIESFALGRSNNWAWDEVERVAFGDKKEKQDNITPSSVLSQGETIN